MKPAPECASCLLKWVYERTAVQLSRGDGFELIRTISGVVQREFFPSANLGLFSNRITDSVSEFISKNAPYYKGLKDGSNKFVEDMLPEARDYVNRGSTTEERLMRALYLAAMSNVAPINAPSGMFTFQETLNLMHGEDSPPHIMGDVFEAVQKAANILYLSDNAGEIGFDSLLISQLREMGARVTLVVREHPFFEDATQDDACFFSLDELTDEILSVKGFFVPHEYSDKLGDVFRKSDLVIAKGTGNYEAQAGELDGKASIHMLKVKCRPIADAVGVKQGTFVIKFDA